MATNSAPLASPRSLGSTVYLPTPRYLPSSSSLMVKRECPVPNKPNTYEASFNTDATTVLRALENVPAWTGNRAQSLRAGLPLRQMATIAPFANVAPPTELLTAELTPRAPAPASGAKRPAVAGMTLNLERVHQMRAAEEQHALHPTQQQPHTQQQQKQQQQQQQHKENVLPIPAPPAVPRAPQTSRPPSSRARATAAVSFASPSSHASTSASAAAATSAAAPTASATIVPSLPLSSMSATAAVAAPAVVAAAPAPTPTPRGQSARAPPPYIPPSSSHWVSTSRSAYMPPPPGTRAPPRMHGYAGAPDSTFAASAAAAANGGSVSFAPTVEAGHFRSRYQADFGAQPGRAPAFDGPSTKDLCMGTPRSHPHYIAGTTTHIPSAPFTTARVVPLTHKFNHAKDFPMSSYQYNMQGYSGHAGRRMNAARQTSVSAAYVDWSNPLF